MLTGELNNSLRTVPQMLKLTHEQRNEWFRNALLLQRARHARKPIGDGMRGHGQRERPTDQTKHAEYFIIDLSHRSFIL